MQPMKPDLRLSAAAARRFMVRRHLLAPPRSLPSEPASVLRVVERLGSLQFDPLEVPGARNHDLVLHARIDGYRRAWTDAWLYGPERQLIELYNKSLNILPIAELPHHALAWDRSARHHRDGILREQSAVVDAVLERIRRDGPLSSASFREHGEAIDWWWAPTRAGRAVLEALFVSGRVGIARRQGNRRYFDLIERLVPADLLERRESDEDSLRHRLLSRFRGVGLLGAGGQAEIVHGTGSAVERVRRTAELVDVGLLVPAEVEGLKGVRYLLAEEVPLLGDAAPVAPAVTFVAPLDPIAWDRRLLRELWGFHYTWEVYVPAAKRRHGYYVLPILFGDRFVGRIEPRVDRVRRRLTILGVAFEPGFDPLESPGFLPALREALATYGSFVGAGRGVSWPRTRPGRDLAGALRRLA